MGEFSLRIELGNEVMRTHQNVGQALNYLSWILIKNGSIDLPDRGAIIDTNGNTVGTWKYQP